jgi:isoquinoline 1-oxidoreductase beta subunit
MRYFRNIALVPRLDRRPSGGDLDRKRRSACFIARIAVDCGVAINPSTVVAQMESDIVYGLTAALYGEITLKHGRVEQSNFHTYPMLHLAQMPKIAVSIIEGAEQPGGIGEPSTPPIAPAVANALFPATGKRLRSLPIAKQGVNVT